MLIEFRVKNFRSIRDEMVFSMVATKDATLRETNTMPSGLKSVPHILRGAALHGANASGKTNFVRAIHYMRSVVVEYAIKAPGQPFSVQPFRLNAETNEQPSEFEVTFLLDGVRHQYGFSMTRQRIVQEYLLVYKTLKPQTWFERQYDAETNQYQFHFGTGLKGPKNTWEQATRPDSLLLSSAVQLNSEALRPIYDWFDTHLIIINNIRPKDPLLSIKTLKQESTRQEVCTFLKAADISISDILIDTQKATKMALVFNPENKSVEVKDEEEENEKLLFLHKTDHGQAVLEAQDESQGTMKLLYLSVRIFDILGKGLTLLVDELDNSLHPLLVKELVQLFHQNHTNTGGAQLIFTTHNTSLMDHDLFRRDQIWFVEKDIDQASCLVPLSEFAPRKNEALERGYLNGRYGGVPFLGDLSGVIAHGPA
ncbi:hypothetical protein SIID45300_01356 [Candidatus Magnetaquicoccaceae bacterium FCR-1]|uniref:ATPase AAA-type core domain-containing protein n=2 Tax=Candidatus Magnetaquiglobus chichijimensis TaxID=3141448 RepID=A0ABQ0C827_9PROT